MQSRKRRTFVLGVALASLTTRVAAQPQKMFRVGMMLAQPAPSPLTNAFVDALRGYGYVEGKTLHIEYRSVEGKFERFPQVAAELVRLGVDVIVAGGTAATRAAKAATRTIPIVFPAVTDPIAEGFVHSLARPGSNATGLSLVESEINAKRIQVLKELLPRVKRVALLVNSKEMATVEQQVRATEDAARAQGVELLVLRAGTIEEIRQAFSAAKSGRAEAFIAHASAYFATHRKVLVDLAAQYNMAALWQHRQFTEIGGLLSYGPDFAQLYREAARYVHRIRNGANPAELPVEQATKFELVINERTAAAQKLRLPTGLLMRADQVLR